MAGDNVPHSFVFTGTYELPFGKSSSGALALLLKGWTVNGILRYDAGRPLAISMNNDLAGLLFNTTKRPNVVSGSSLVATPGDGGFDPNRDRYFNTCGMDRSGAAPVRQRPQPRRQRVRGFMNIVEDVSVFKVTKLQGALTRSASKRKAAT